MFESIVNAYKRQWASINYSFCKSEEYLAMQRGELLKSAEWGSRASQWQLEYLMIGRRLV